MRTKQKWIQGLVSGMDQATNPAIVANNESPLLKNISLYSPGSWTSRKGLEKFGNTVTESDLPYGLFTYNKNDGTYELGMITDRDLYFYDEGTSSFGTAVDTDEWPANERVNAKNFKNKVYLGSEDGGTPLSYTTGGAITDITPSIGGSQIAINKNVLAVAGNNIDPQIVFYSDPYTDIFHRTSSTIASISSQTLNIDDEVLEPGMQGSIIYNTTEGEFALFNEYTDSDTVETVGDISAWAVSDTVYIMDNVFKLDDASTGLVGFSENFVSWDQDNTYLWDPTQQPDGWSQKLPDAPGCVSHRTVQVIGGKYIIWANRDTIWLMTPDNNITDIGAKIRNKYSGEGIIDLIDFGLAEDWMSWKDDAEEIYWLSVGDLVTKSGALASGIENCVLAFDLKKGASWIESYQNPPVSATSFIDENGNKDVYIGLNDTSTIYKTRQLSVDEDKDGNNNEIDLAIHTQHHTLGNPMMNSRLQAMIFRYISHSPLKISYSKDRGSYNYVDDLPASTTVTERKLLPIADSEAWSHSLKIEQLNSGYLEFSGSGANDLELNNEFTGESLTEYVVEIDSEGTPDTFRWSNDGGDTWDTEDISITGSAQTLENGVEITFDSTTGHEVGDQWTFQGGPTDLSLEGYGFEYVELNTLKLSNE